MAPPSDASPPAGTLPDSVWRSIVEGASDGIFVTDASLRIAWVNARAAEILALPVDAIVGRTIAELIVPDDLAQAPLRGEDLRAGRTTTTVRLFRAGDGVLRALEVTARMVASGYVVGFARDATERIDAEGRIARSEASFRALIVNSPDGVAVHRGGTIVYANPALARMLGWESERALVGRAVLDLVHPDDRTSVHARIGELSAEDATVPFVEERLVRRDGVAVVTSVGGMHVVFEGSAAVAAVVRDVTEQRRIEARLAHADRLTSLGVLAAGVAHEVNNPLAYVMLRLEAMSAAGARMRRELAELRASLETKVGETAARDLLGGRISEALGELDDHLVTAHEGAQRVQRIVQDLRTFARADSGDRVASDVRAEMNLAESMASHELRPRARVLREYETVPPVVAARGQLAQVFLNLILNAAQSIAGEDPARNEVRLRIWSEGTWVHASVSDTGRGIPRDNLMRLFEPFFTTKPAGDGCGLGLAICDGIVSSLGGRIRVESVEGKGSTFTVDLPAAARAT